MTRFLKPLSVIVVALLVLGGGGLLLSREEEETYTITAYFTKAIGLFENSDVDIIGVPVGKVTNITPMGEKVRVVMELPTKYKVPKEAFAQIVPISIIADRYVQLHPPYTGGEYLKDGAVLDVDRTQIPAELDDVFKQLKKLLEAIEPGKEGEPGALGDLIVQLNETLKGSEQDLKGTLINAAALTESLADSKTDLAGLLTNLDDLFNQLATRAGSLGTLNRNFAVVMTTLLESDGDLRGTLKNLGDLTVEVGDLVREHGDRLGSDLTRAAKITSTVLDNRASVEESLRWLPVVGEGLRNAHHGAPVFGSDVRDNAISARCEALDDLPQEVQDILDEALGEACGEPPGAEGPTLTQTPEEEVELDCDKGVRKVKQQLRRVGTIELPDDVLNEVVDPMKKQLRRLKKECKNLGKLLRDPDEEIQDLLDDILEQVPDPGVDAPGVDDLGPSAPRPGPGAAAGAGAAPSQNDPSSWDRFSGWFSGFVGFLGWAR
ncbi:MAG TPA: MCE family protein [Actinomycetota bacterium]|nr:MCE family protein [Actinomycetota bacterium]